MSADTSDFFIARRRGRDVDGVQCTLTLFHHLFENFHSAFVAFSECSEIALECYAVRFLQSVFDDGAVAKKKVDGDGGAGGEREHHCFLVFWKNLPRSKNSQRYVARLTCRLELKVSFWFNFRLFLGAFKRDVARHRNVRGFLRGW